MTVWHVGRSFTGTRLEDECPCPKAPCGLVISDERDPSCEHHQLYQTTRRGHPADQCPGREDDN